MDLFDSSDSQKGASKAAAINVEITEPWSRFSAWLECVCVVTFDLELGQAIELVYPHDVKLTEKEKTSICYLSFPDSYSGCLGDTHFSFRLRQSVGRSGSWFEQEDKYNRDAPVTMQKEHAHFHGYVYFRQVKDASVKRGYFQKSLVVVSRLPFVHLFHSLLKVIAPEYFEKLEPCLETVCNEIDQWPAPIPGQTLNLPVMGVVMQVRIPSKDEAPGGSPVKQTQTEHVLPAPTILPSVHELDLFQCFQSILIHMQMLWELMLLGEPVVVMAPSPTVSSETVLALVSSITPLRYCGDYRPYFTIHDSEFKEYTTRTQAPPNVILGVTNPFFIKTFQCWPHIIRLGDLKMSGDLPKQVKTKKLAKLKTLDAKPGYPEKKAIRGSEQHHEAASTGADKEFHSPTGAVFVHSDAPTENCDSMEDPSSDPVLQSGGVFEDPGASRAAAYLCAERRLDGPVQTFFSFSKLRWLVSSQTQRDDSESRMSSFRGHLCSCEYSINPYS
ncbi:protein DENND6B isoform X2 [Myxocyprinus asiaticus]|uniref:protein DENND6B isoform X2 n=1 Tax=Myxocyprinus asiaticus TaxID=70543 RepID=UPI0022220F73|nr:protein DENND6B isoform X2 [Myxocyprinus asiaticus]